MNNKFLSNYISPKYIDEYFLYLTSVPGYLVDNIKIDALYLGKMAYIVKIKKIKLIPPVPGIFAQLLFPV